MTAQPLEHFRKNASVPGVASQSVSFRRPSIETPITHAAARPMPSEVGITGSLVHEIKGAVTPVIRNPAKTIVQKAVNAGTGLILPFGIGSGWLQKLLQRRYGYNPYTDAQEEGIKRAARNAALLEPDTFHLRSNLPVMPTRLSPNRVAPTGAYVPRGMIENVLNRNEPQPTAFVRRAPILSLSDKVARAKTPGRYRIARLPRGRGRF